jgi:large subunit ribosomal protein L26e
MKTHRDVTSSRRKSRLAHFSAPSHLRYKIMSASLSKELRTKHGVRSMPIRRDDEVTIVRGNSKDSKGKVTQVYRKRWCIYIEKLTKNRVNGATIRVPIHPSNCVITKMKLTPDRESLIRRKAEGKGDKNKGKYTVQDVKK